MNAMRKFFSLRDTNSRRIWALFCIAVFFAVQIVAFSPQFHRWLHPDADSAGHQCAITAIHHGQLSLGDISPPSVAFIAPSIFVLPSLSLPEYSSFDYRLSSSRAPPTA